MKKRWQSIFKLLRDIMKITPLSCLVIFAYYVFNSFYPGVITFLSESVFQAAEQLDGDSSSSELFFSIVMQFLLFYIIKNLMDMAIDAPRSTGIYTKVQYVMDRKLAEKVSLLSYIKFEDTQTYNSIYKARQAVEKKYFQRAFFSFLSVFSVGFGIVGIASVLFSFNPFLLPLNIICVIPQLIARMIRGSEYYELKTQQIPKQRKANYFWNLFSNRVAVKELRAYHSYDYIYKKWRSLTEDIYKEQSAFIKKESRSLFLCQILQNVSLILCIILCAVLTFSGKLQISEFAASISAIIMTQTLFKELMIHLSSLLFSSKFVSDYYNVFSEPQDSIKGVSIQKIQSINFEEVYFKYPMGVDYAISDTSFSISPGETIVIVGENGSGKTTLSKLILGLYKPDKGTVSYNDISSEYIDVETLYQNLSVLPQLFTKYNLSVKDNIAMSNTESLEKTKKIQQLLKYVNLEELADDSHLNLLLGKEYGGVELSGGEWQRLAIARALYKDCDLLILDEPTSALDPAIESEILERFVEMTKGNQTTIIISHRVGLCTIADKIIVVKEGTVIAVGNHNDLYKKNKYYHTLFEEQRKWYV